MKVKQALYNLSLLIVGLFQFSGVSFGQEGDWKNESMTSEDAIEIFGLLAIGFVMLGILIWMFRLVNRKKLNSERFIFIHNLLTSRLILTFGAVAYPFLNYINYITEDRITRPELWFPFSVGIIMLVLVVASFKIEKIKKILPKTVVIFYLTILFHVSLITLLNFIIPLHVIGLCLVISLASIIVDNPLKLLFSGTIYLGVMITLTYYIPLTILPKTQLISALFTAVLIAFLLGLTKRTLNERLSLGSKIMNDLETAIIITDKEGTIQYVNVGAKNLFGIKRREFLGMGWWKISSHKMEDPKEIRDYVSNLYNHLDENIITNEVNSDKEEIVLDWGYQLMDNGWIAMIGQDITEKFNVEKELNKLSFVAKYANVGIIICDKDSRVEWANSKFEEITGYKVQDFIGKRPGDLLTGPDTDLASIESTRAVENVVSNTQIENLNYKKDGEPFWVSVVSSPIYDAQGEIEQIVEVVQDVTLQKKNEEELAMEAKTNALLTKIDSALIKEPDWNSSMKHVLSLLRKEFPETAKCVFYEIDGGHMLMHSHDVEGLPKLSLDHSRALQSIKNYMFGPRLIYNQKESEPWAEPIQDAMDVSHKSNFIFYKITEKNNLLGYFVVASEDPNFIRTEIISIFGKFVEYTNLKLLQYLDDLRIKYLNKKLFHINELSSAVLNGDDVEEKIHNLLLDLVGDSLVKANIMVYDFENNTASYQYSYQENGQTNSNVLSIDQISEQAIKTLRQNRYFAIGDISSRKNKSKTDIKMEEAGVVSFMMFPLFQDLELFGSLNISMNKPLSQLDQSLEGFLNDLTEELSISIYQKLLQEQVTRDKNVIEELHKDVSASVRSAERIQRTILPGEELFKQNFNDFFVLYKPKDVVSGDFFYLNKVDDKIIVAAADCTGHGVPGALVSMVCKNAMDKVILEQKVYDSAKILELTRDEIIKKFDSVDDVYEGMDIALCVLDLKNQTICFAGAQNPLWVVKNGDKEIIEFKGDKIGVNKLYAGKEFSKHGMPFEKGDRFYMFSDGFSDQFGGERFKKFGQERMKNLIIDNNNMKLSKQQAVFNDAIVSWQGVNDQIDDICLMSIEI